MGAEQVLLLLAPHARELNLINGDELLERQAEGERDQYVNFQQRLAAGEVDAERRATLPVGGQGRPRGFQGQAGVGGGEAFGFKLRRKALPPKWSVVCRKT